MTRDERTDARLNELLERARLGAWPGPDHHPRVDAMLKEHAMRNGKTLSRTTIGAIAIALLGGGALATAVTYSVMTQRATLVTEDGSQYEVDLLPSPEGASGKFVADDGTVYGIEMVEGETRRTRVDVEAADDVDTTVSMEDPGFRARVKVPEGETATITVEDVAADEEGGNGDG